MLFLLTITEKNGSWAGRPPFTSTHGTREDAEVALIDYVQRNWDAEVGTEPPSDPEEMVAEYFDDVLETYTISKA